MVKSGTDDDGIVPSPDAGAKVACKKFLLSCRIFSAAEIQAAPRHSLMQHTTRLLQCLTLRQQLTKPHPGHFWIQLLVL